MKQKNKYQQWRKAIKNPPADRLAKIEYQSHFLQMIGITIVSIILIYKGLWYIIFAFIFMLGINYSQGMNAYRKYQNIKEFMPKENPKDYEKDISPSRRRGKIIEHVYGSRAKWVSILISVMLLTMIEFSINTTWIIRSLIYPLLLGFFHWFFYFVITYKLAYLIYKKGIRE